LLAEVALNFVELRTLQARLEYARSNVRLQENSLELARNRFATGLSPRLDITQAESNLATTESEIPLLEIGIAQTINRLGVLLGRPPSTLYDELTPPGRIPMPPQEVAVGLPADLLRQRPDVRRAERLLAAFTARIGVAAADLYPRFSLSGTFALQGTQLKNLGNINAADWSFGPAMRWNIFDGLRNIQRVHAAEEVANQAFMRYKQTVLTALEEVESAMVAYKQEQIRRDALGRAVVASEEAVKLVRDLYENGLTDFQNVLDTERSLFRQQDQLAASEGTVARNLIAIYKALGGGWRHFADDVEGVDSATVIAERPASDAPGPATREPQG
jgi:NodT family efflux transporter outer membrane factor (OMF) lipoprotein